VSGAHLVSGRELVKGSSAGVNTLALLPIKAGHSRGYWRKGRKVVKQNSPRDKVPHSEEVTTVSPTIGGHLFARPAVPTSQAGRSITQPRVSSMEAAK
jgi:hypothetical protein